MYQVYLKKIFRCRLAIDFQPLLFGLVHSLVRSPLMLQVSLFPFAQLFEVRRSACDSSLNASLSTLTVEVAKSCSPIVHLVAQHDSPFWWGNGLPDSHSEIGIKVVQKTIICCVFHYRILERISSCTSLSLRQSSNI